MKRSSRLEFLINLNKGEDDEGCLKFGNILKGSAMQEKLQKGCVESTVRYDSIKSKKLDASIEVCCANLHCHWPRTKLWCTFSMIVWPVNLHNHPWVDVLLWERSTHITTDPTTLYGSSEVCSVKLLCHWPQTKLGGTCSRIVCPVMAVNLRMTITVWTKPNR